MKCFYLPLKCFEFSQTEMTDAHAYRNEGGGERAPITPREYVSEEVKEREKERKKEEGKR